MALLAGANQPVLWDIAREMRSAGRSWALREDGETIVIAGLYPMDDGRAEAWFGVAPAAARHMPLIIRNMRLTIENSGYREIVTVARTRQGEIIARRLGFRFVQETTFGDLMLWQTSLVAAAATTDRPQHSPRNSAAR